MTEQTTKTVVLSEAFPTLSRREREVFALIVQGVQGKEAARTLGISYRTVDDHRQAIYRKLNVNNGVQLLNKLVDMPKVVIGENSL